LFLLELRVFSDATNIILAFSSIFVDLFDIFWIYWWFFFVFNFRYWFIWYCLLTYLELFFYYLIMNLFLIH